VLFSTSPGVIYPPVSIVHRRWAAKNNSDVDLINDFIGENPTRQKIINNDEMFHLAIVQRLQDKGEVEAARAAVREIQQARRQSQELEREEQSGTDSQTA
jgi:hypothetical protein